MSHLQIVIDLTSRIEKLNGIREIKIVKVVIERSGEDIGLNSLESLEKLEDITPEAVFMKRLELERELNRESRGRLLDRFREIVGMVELDEN